jgi:hypothetical protein
MTDGDLVRAGRTLTAMGDVEDVETERPKRWDFSWNRWPNRLGYSLAAGTVINLATDIKPLGLTVTVMLFVLTSAIVAARR